MIKLNTNIKDKPILATLLIAVIIGLVCFIVFILNYFGPITPNIPKLVIEVGDLEENIELEPISYYWVHNGTDESKEYAFDPNNYDYSNCTIYKSYMGYSPMMKSDPKLNMKTISKTTYMYNPDTKKYEQYEIDFLDFSKAKVNEHSVHLKSSSGATHIYVSYYTINYGSQGKASYVVKVVEQDDYRLGILKEYKGITLGQKDELKELLSKLSFGNYLDSIEVNENKINLIYKYRIGNDATKTISVALFSLIDNLEEITFTHLNNEFLKAERSENGTFENKPIEYTDPTIITKEELIQTLNLDLENLKKTFGL